MVEIGHAAAFRSVRLLWRQYDKNGLDLVERGCERRIPLDHVGRRVAMRAKAFAL